MSSEQPSEKRKYFAGYPVVAPKLATSKLEDWINKHAKVRLTMKTQGHGFRRSDKEGKNLGGRYRVLFQTVRHALIAIPQGKVAKLFSPTENLAREHETTMKESLRHQTDELKKIRDILGPWCVSSEEDLEFLFLQNRDSSIESYTAPSLIMENLSQKGFVELDNFLTDLKKNPDRFQKKGEIIVFILLQFLEICSLLQAHHIFHGDLKSDNVFIHPETFQLVLMDWELVNTLQEKMGLTGIQGHPSYLPPEAKYADPSDRSVFERVEVYRLAMLFLVFFAENQEELFESMDGYDRFGDHKKLTPKEISQIVFKNTQSALFQASIEECHIAAGAFRGVLEAALQQYPHLRTQSLSEFREQFHELLSSERLTVFLEWVNSFLQSSSPTSTKKGEVTQSPLALPGSQTAGK